MAPPPRSMAPLTRPAPPFVVGLSRPVRPRSTPPPTPSSPSTPARVGPVFLDAGSVYLRPSCHRICAVGPPLQPASSPPGGSLVPQLPRLLPAASAPPSADPAQLLRPRSAQTSLGRPQRRPCLPRPPLSAACLPRPQPVPATSSPRPSKHARAPPELLTATSSPELPWDFLNTVGPGRRLPVPWPCSTDAIDAPSHPRLPAGRPGSPAQSRQGCPADFPTAGDKPLLSTFGFPLVALYVFV